MKLYNTLTREKQEFVPLEEGKVKMYSCGPTVYDYFHIGNARPFIIFDTLRRYLEYRGYQVQFVQNFTDVDDKMIARANEEGITVKELADRFIQEYFVDAQGLGIERATVHPRATENMDSIIALIRKLEEKGFAYAVDGDVYFAAKKFHDYGKLSHQPLEDLESGARIGVDERKEDPIDFALWKAQKPGEPAWESPWGMGRPGWHIECSAMVNRYLGETIDIHSGGVDLVFPHHENEIAQSEAATGKPFVRYWLHNGHININNQKMSKSSGNFFSVRDVAKIFDYEAIRFFMLSAHYRTPINFSKESMESASNALQRLYTCVEHLEFLQEKGIEREMTEEERRSYETIMNYRQNFITAMEDDLNTADAVSVLFEIVRQVYNDTNLEQTYAKTYSKGVLDLLLELGGVLGLFKRGGKEQIPAEIIQLAQRRAQARTDKDWALADKLRDELKEKGYQVKDTPQGPKISRIEA